MGFKSNKDNVIKALERADLAGIEAMAEFARQKAYNRAPVQAGTSADGVYKSHSKPPKIMPAGTYRNTIKASFDENGFIIGSDDILAGALELGTSKGNPPFPHFQPAVEENPEEYARILQGEYSKNVE
jgi:hypothetical protein